MINWIKQALNISKITAKKVLKCKICGKEYKSAFDRKHNYFCSTECSKQRPTYHYICSYCQNPFTRTVLSNLKRNYCCAKCRCTYNSKFKNKIKIES